MAGRLPGGDDPDHLSPPQGVYDHKKTE